MEIIKKGIYEFDTDARGIPVFTEKNIALITAMVENDSSYRRSFDKECEDSSAGFLYKKLPKCEEDILEAIKRIDRENSTHLSVTGKGGGGRERAAKYICEHCEGIWKQIKDGRVEIVEKLSKELVPERYNISFASKFCAFVDRYWFGGDHFSIVDDVLCRVLPAYEALYLGTAELVRNKWIRQKEKKAFNYKEYQKTIESILKNINSGGDVSQNVTRQQFDLFLWYYYKGSDDRIKKLYEDISKRA